MSYQEKRAIASIISSVIMFGIYYMIIYRMYRDGSFAGADAGSLLGKSVLILIAGGIILHIIVTIICNILFALAERECNPSYVVDERDKLIELRSMRFSEWVTGLGFVLSMIALAMGQPAFLVINLIVGAFALGSVMGSVAMLAIHRKGF